MSPPPSEADGTANAARGEGSKEESAKSICGWPVESGVWWIQTNDPVFARKLAKRSDTRLVAVGVAGGFLRIFEMPRSPAFIRRLIARYMAANARFRDPGARDKAPNGAAGQ